MPGFLEARSLENSNDPDANDVKLSLVTADKRPKTTATNGKRANGKLLSAITKLVLGIGQDGRIEKILTLKNG